MAGALKCDICGGALVAKADGVFVCEYCGMKYDKSRIQQMVQEIHGTVSVEGTVEVTGKVQVDGGTVEVDMSARKENYLGIARQALNGNNLKEALSYANQVLEIDSSNGEAMYIKGYALIWSSSLANRQLLAGSECWKNYLFSLDEDKRERECTKLMNELKRAYSALVDNEAGLLATAYSLNEVNQIAHVILNIRNEHIQAMGNMLKAVPSRDEELPIAYLSLATLKNMATKMTSNADRQIMIWKGSQELGSSAKDALLAALGLVTYLPLLSDDERLQAYSPLERMIGSLCASLKKAQFKPGISQYYATLREDKAKFMREREEKFRKEHPEEWKKQQEEIRRKEEAERQAKIEKERKEKYDNIVKQKNEARNSQTILEAAKAFDSLGDYKDCKEQAEECRQKAAEMQTIEKERAKKAKKVAAIVVLIGVACLVVYILLNSVIIPNNKYNAALELMDAGEYEEAIEAFEALDGHKDSTKQIENCENFIFEIAYDDAIALMDAGEYEDAIVAFQALGEHKDSAEQIENCETAIMDIAYDDAVELMDAGKYEEAITAFEALDGYQESAEKIEACESAISDIAYDKAISYIEDGNIVKGYEALIALDGYKDSALRAEDVYTQYELALLSNASVGDIVSFGAYEQDNVTTNGKESIEWLVLEKTDSKIFVISDKGLEGQPYNTSNDNVTWESCTLRSWLNREFLDSAFTPEEQNVILNVSVSADSNPEYSTYQGNNTMDQVFLLSIKEVDKYSVAKCFATEYALAHGVIADTYSGLNTSHYWLRTSGMSQDAATFVGFDGDVSYIGSKVSYKSSCIRPALWINLDS